MRFQIASGVFALSWPARIWLLCFLLAVSTVLIVIGWGLYSAVTQLLADARVVTEHRIVPSGNQGDRNNPAPGAEEATLAVRSGDDGYILLRIFKRSGDIELWRKRGGRYSKSAEFRLCPGVVALGPKRRRDDGVLPEGFYPIPVGLLEWSQETKKDELPVGFPNTYDLGRGSSGGPLYIEGGCDGDVEPGSGFFVPSGDMSKLLVAFSKAREMGQKSFPLHIFPFEMKWSNLVSFKGTKNFGFWLNLKEVNDLFIKEGQLPDMGVCGLRYWASVPSQGDEPKRIEDDFSCLPLLPGSEVPIKVARRNSWLFQALEDQKLSFWRTKRAISMIEVKCNMKRPSCRRWYNLRKRVIENGGDVPEWSPQR